ncbi:MAG TPA: TIGR02301 family protein [Methyloceanibacter sp.]|nr:TIGR02301 family protein [Methyloceanibacter sp.]
MKSTARRPLRLGFGISLFALAMLGWSQVAEAQFFWSPFFQEQPAARAKPRPAKPKTPADDLPPIVPKESSAPPPPDDRPYDAKLLRLAEILGAVHYLRELCGAQEGQLWRDQMKEIVKNEGSTAVRRAKLVNSFNDGYRGYRRTYRSCTSSATLAIARFSAEGAQIATTLAKPSSYASRASSDATPSSGATNGGAPASGAKTDDVKKPDEAKAESTPNAGNQSGAKKGEATQAAPAGAADATATDTGRGHKPRHAKKQSPSQEAPVEGF